MGNQEFGVHNRLDVCSHACLHDEDSEIIESIIPLPLLIMFVESLRASPRQLIS